MEKRSERIQMTIWNHIIENTTDMTQKSDLTSFLQGQLQDILLYKNFKWFQMMRMWQQTWVAQRNTDLKDASVVNTHSGVLMNEG